MVKIYVPEEKELYTRKMKKLQKKKAETKEIESEESQAYFNIWDMHPSFKDINNVFSIIKTLSLIALILLVISVSYIFNQNLFLSLLIGLVILSVFIIVFHDEFFLLRKVFSSAFSKKLTFNPFEHLIFWFDKDERSVLYCTNRSDLSNIAIQVFRVEVIPEKVEPTIRHFLRSLSMENIENIRLSFSYQVVQRPKIDSFGKGAPRYTSMQSLGSFTTSIYFTVFCHRKGILTNSKLDYLRHYINLFSVIFRNNLVANFHHFKIKLLSDLDLINALRTFYIKKDISLSTGVVNKREMINGSKFNNVGRFLFCVIIVIYFLYYLWNNHIPFIYIISINIGIPTCILLIWWRSLFFQVTKKKIITTENISLVNPFEDVQFYRLREFPYSLFLHINNKLLLGIKMVNLKYIKKRPYSHMEGFFESLNSAQIPFSYTLKNRPIGYYEFYRYGLDHVREKLQKELRWKHIRNKADEEEWLSTRRGMWYSILTLSVHTYNFITTVTRDQFYELEEELINKNNRLKGSFNSVFQNFKIEDLRSKRLLSGYLFTSLKNNHFRMNGTQLYELMMQGVTLTPLNTIVNVFKKGIETKVAAEFNTPLYLENYITYGHTENTEILESEVPAGFTLKQLKNLLIVQGTTTHRDLMSMKLVSELIKIDCPCIVFDFDGTWSKLIDYFKKTHHLSNILYFKLGSAFTIDPLVSDIPYDTNNPEYLEYMFDALALAFKKDQRFIDMFRAFIKKNPGKDFKSLELESETQNEWQKRPNDDSLLTLFTNFTHQDLSLFQGFAGRENIHAHDFVVNKKTVIIDLSSLRDLDKKLFGTFVILSKIIHYIKNGNEFQDKIIVVPNIDLFFNATFLDWKMNYGKINTFLDPLIKQGFGFIFSANKIHYLHSHLFNYFHNFISFRTIEHRSILLLKNLMNLQEMSGAGYYSSKRNNAYQFEYLMNLKNNDILVRRDDIYQAFPASVEWTTLQNSPVHHYEDIVNFMETQGYNLAYNEQKILQQARKTIFEKDLVNYFPYLQEIIIFLDEVKSIDQIGNNYAQKLKKQLKQILYPKISQKTNNKEYIKKLRDGIFNILLKHGYLIEGHPKRAGGSEALRTSYLVGDQYQIALEDYFETTGRAASDINVEILEKGIQGSEEIPSLLSPESQSRKFIIQKGNLREACAREFSDFNYEVFKIDKFIEDNDFKNAAKLERGLIKKFLESIYRHFYDIDHKISSNKMEQFIAAIADSEGFPFTKQEYQDYYEKSDNLNLNTENLKEMTEDVYHHIFQFLAKMYNYLYGK